MVFTAAEMPVFARSGARIGTITGFSITGARSYAFNDIEDLTFVIPLRDETGAAVYTAAMQALLDRDNLVYIANEFAEMEGWGGVISDVVEGSNEVTVTCLGGLSLFTDINTTLISQSEGTSSMIATRLVAAAAAKKGIHGDVVPTLVIDGDTNMPGIWKFEGEVLDGLEQLASDGLAEMYVEGVLSGDAQSLAFVLHWNGIGVSVDNSAFVLHDGPNGQVKSSPEFVYSGLEVINHAKMKGLPTDLGEYVDYASVRSIIVDIVPEIEVTLDDPGYENYRRREDLNLSVNFGYPEAIQRAAAEAIQQEYVDYFKTFLYAYHHRQGKPFLPGFDWQGPDGTNERRLTMTRFRTLNRMGRIGAATVITADSDMDTDTAEITDWSLDARFNPTGLGTIAGIALNYANLDEHFVAAEGGGLVVLESDYETYEDVGTIAVGGGTLVGIATDPASLSTLWAAIRNGAGTNVTIRAYDADDLTVLSEYVVTAGNVTDIAVDYDAGRLYLASTDNGGEIQVRDLSNGLLLSPDVSFASGFASPTGLTVSGGIAYVANSSGTVRMVYVDTGNLAGDFNTGVAISGAMLADIGNRRVYLSHGGDLSVYNAYVAVASVGAPGDVDGAPGFDNIVSGAFVHIVYMSDFAYRRKGSQSSTTYNVVSGDTLWSIAKHFYGSGSSWPTIYRANKATIISTAQAHGFTENYAHWIFPGEDLVIPGYDKGESTPDPPNTNTKYLVVYTPGGWDTQIEPGPVGEPALLRRTWVETSDQVVGFVNENKCKPVRSNLVVQGEEGRVDDWDPSRDGYGRYKEEQRYRTPRGNIQEEGPGWYPEDWDVPTSNWTIPQQPWPAGEQYLADYLAKRNREVTIQAFSITNEGGAWLQVRRGALLTLQIGLQGPVDVPTTQTIRVLAYAPDEAAGEMEIVAEQWTP